MTAGTAQGGLLAFPKQVRGGVDRVHDPVIHVSGHVGMEFMRGAVGDELDIHTGGVEESEITSSLGESGLGIGDAVADEDLEASDGVQVKEGLAIGFGDRAVQGDNPGDAIGHAEPDAIGDAGPFADAGEKDAFRMDMVSAACLFDGPHEIVRGFFGAFQVFPGKTRSTVRANTELAGPSQADTDVIPSAQLGSQA